MAETDWGERTLGDLVDILHGFAFKGEFFTDEESVDVLLTPGNFAIGGGFKADKLKYYRGPVPDGYVLEAGDLIVTMTDLSKSGDTLGYPATVPHDPNHRYLHNQRLGKVVLKPGSPLNLRFLYHLLRTRTYRDEVLAGATGTTVKHTSPSRISTFRFLLPPQWEQEAIARILDAFDDKIELNRQMNKTLEDMAQALFKSWFVDFDPIRARAEARNGSFPDGVLGLFPDSLAASESGPIPVGWSVGSVYALADVIYGKPFASQHFNSDGAGVPLIRIRDLSTNEPATWTTEDYDEGYAVTQGDLLVGMDGEFKPCLWTGPSAVLNQRVCKFKPKTGVPVAYLKQVLVEPLDFFERSKAGTTVIHLGKGDIDTVRVLIPPQRVIDAFADLTNPMIRQILVNASQSRTIRAIRDLLLPKLLSGELRVSEAERMVEKTL